MGSIPKHTDVSFIFAEVKKKKSWEYQCFVESRVLPHLTESEQTAAHRAFSLGRGHSNVPSLSKRIQSQH